jgi:predicted metal-dependent peptidase
MSAEEILADRRKNQPPPKPKSESKPSEPQEGEDEGKGDSEPNDRGEPDDKSKGKGKSEKSDQRSREEGAWGEFEPQAKSDDLSSKDMDNEWERRLIQAATVCKMQGKLPGCIEAIVKDLIDPKVPWNQLLNRFFDATSANDYSWAKPDRRFLPHDIIVPDLHDDTLGEIVIAIDTSGSIFGNQSVLESFQSEINSIIERTRPSKTTVIYCDADVQHTDEYHDGAPITIIPRGGGGTDFRPVGTYIESHNISPRVCIYLTDLYGDFPDREWPYPTIWAVYGNETGVAPFGDTIHIPNK